MATLANRDVTSFALLVFILFVVLGVLLSIVLSVALVFVVGVVQVVVMFFCGCCSSLLFRVLFWLLF